MFIPDQRQRGGEKGDLPQCTQRTEQITAEIKGNLFIDIHQTQHSDMADTGEYGQLITGPDSSVAEPVAVTFKV